MIRITSFVVTIVVMLITAKTIAPPALEVSPLLVAVGILDTSAYVFNNFGMLREQVSVVSVLASLYGAVTVGLAATLLRENVSRMQWVGMVAVFLGIWLISR
jgi:drug/metabolite transporter (DMT)-like permease